MNCKRLFLAAFALTLVFSSCKKDDPTPEPDPVDTNTPSGNNYFFSHTINGSVQTFEDTKNNYYWSFSTGGEIGEVNSVMHITMDSGGGLNDINASEYSGCDLSFNDGYSGPTQYYYDNTEAVMADIFTVGSHPYSSGTSSEGVSFTLKHGTGIYKSELGTQPSSSTLNVSESTAATGPMGEARRKVKGTYTCRLFNENNTADFIDVSNGSFSGVFEAY
ncbi:MAG: hypothetical protein K0R65_421 [Crocinitomicaceae bacterium]|jgi:hypothetical protein|nr:hypothetical protein [Crocinitomicaceae bacterium]